LTVRAAKDADREAIWSIIEPVIRAGDSYAIDKDITKEDALRYWLGSERQTFVFEDGGEVLGTYFLRANQGGGGSHVANCGYVTASRAAGKGIARRMCLHSLELARREGFRAMQFNLVVSTNERAVRLWQSLGFRIVGTLPEAFDHPSAGLVDAYVMFASLDEI
jgi:ribosomal protein S18 acetylase RimI-like enzyme